jgi:hypothetical protein
VEEQKTRLSTDLILLRRKSNSSWWLKESLSFLKKTLLVLSIRNYWDSLKCYLKIRHQECNNFLNKRCSAHLINTRSREED